MWRHWLEVQAAPTVCFRFSEPVYHKKTGFIVTQEQKELADHEEMLSLFKGVMCLQITDCTFKYTVYPVSQPVCTQQEDVSSSMVFRTIGFLKLPGYLPVCEVQMPSPAVVVVCVFVVRILHTKGS